MKSKPKLSHKLGTVREKFRRRLPLGIALLASVIIGAIVVALTQANPLTVSTEIETGTITGPAARVRAKSASGSGAVVFKAASSSNGSNSTSNNSSSSSSSDNSTSGSSGTGASTTAKGRKYPLHTKINATTFWVGEEFQSTSDGSQVCSAYDSQWQYSYFHLKKGTNSSEGCSGAPTGGCDAAKKSASGKCDDTNSIGSLRTPGNGYFPSGLPQIYENPFYLDLPYDDFNLSDSTDKTGYSTRCNDIPWAKDAGYAGKCKDRSFSYMKNRWVKIMANGKTCYGQIEDAGPADDGNGNGNYADAKYVFSSTDARPYNKSYNSAGMDISPALGSCLGGKFNQDLQLSWQFVDSVDVPSGPWKKIVTTTPPKS